MVVCPFLLWFSETKGWLPLAGKRGSVGNSRGRSSGGRARRTPPRHGEQRRNPARVVGVLGAELSAGPPRHRADDPEAGHHEHDPDDGCGATLPDRPAAPAFAQREDQRERHPADEDGPKWHAVEIFCELHRGGDSESEPAGESIKRS